VITVCSHRRAWLAGAASLAAALLAAACQPATGPAAIRAAGSPPAAASSATATSAADSPAADPPNAAKAAGGPVVALGDSYTAGGLLPADPGAVPPGCLRSTKAYPVLVARALGAPLTDAACASAGVKNMTQPQRTYLGTNPAQLGALAPDDALVLLTLSGDDTGFLNVLHECVKLSFTAPWGSPCRAHYTAGGRDQLAAAVSAVAPKMAQVLAAIRARAPRARIVMVGYPDLFPQSGGCWPAVPITGRDVAYLRGIEVELNAMLAVDAVSAGAIFVNTYAPTAGHDFCTAESVRDVEGLLPGSLVLPFHPNARGQAAIAAAVLAAVNA
jgi:lysophospholipase L1-like esterase